MSERVVVAMSGGVDSSVASALLKQQGYDVIGITMRLWTEQRSTAFKGRTRCCGVEDIDDARRVAQRLDIPHYVLGLERPFHERVVAPFVAEYANGRTPNPCLNCNTFIKFDAFLQRVRAMDADYMATGHYARRLLGPDGVQLHRACDAGKDQSYVLYTLSREVLQRTLFPLGDLVKHDVRAIAARYGLAVAEKPDSADLCFVPNGDYREFVGRYLPERPGVMVDQAGELVGRHAGVQRFTVGQRHGLGVTAERPLFVTAIDAERNVVQVGPEDTLRVAAMELSDCRWLLPHPPTNEISVQVMIRSHMSALPARVRESADGRVVLRFDQSARAVAPGQAAVFYQGDRVLGGGTIERALGPRSAAAPD